MTRSNDDGSRFADSEHLRAVLIRLHNLGTDAWRRDPDADELMRYLIDRFAALAVKHGLEPEDAGSAAWEAIRQPSICTCRDPWGDIATAVKTTLAATQFADLALCSIEKARSGGLEDVYAERFSDREVELWEHHPAFTTTDQHHDDEDAKALQSIREQAETIAGMFIGHGWPPGIADAIEMVLLALAEMDSRPAAYEALRRDWKLPALAGLPRSSWNALLRLLLGRPGNNVTTAGKGILLRLALGETITDLGYDLSLVVEIEQTRPDDPTEPGQVIDLGDARLARHLRARKTAVFGDEGEVAA